MKKEFSIKEYGSHQLAYSAARKFMKKLMADKKYAKYGMFMSHDYINKEYVVQYIRAVE